MLNEPEQPEEVQGLEEPEQSDESEWEMVEIGEQAKESEDLDLVARR